MALDIYYCNSKRLIYDNKIVKLLSQITFHVEGEHLSIKLQYLKRDKTMELYFVTKKGWIWCVSKEIKRKISVQFADIRVKSWCALIVKECEILAEIIRRNRIRLTTHSAKQFWRHNYTSWEPIGSIARVQTAEFSFWLRSKTFLWVWQFNDDFRYKGLSQ